jgi:hypothetical protein
VSIERLEYYRQLVQGDKKTQRPPGLLLNRGDASELGAACLAAEHLERGIAIVSVQQSRPA